jgi:hypothetical protein
MAVKESCQLTTTAAALRERPGECVETGEDGRPRLTVTLPNAEALTALADALARLMKT